VTDRRLTLTASLRPAALDARRGVVRLHPEVLAALGVAAGEPVLLTAGRTTAGIAALAEEASARGLLLADDVTLGNLGVRSGAQVTIEPAPVQAARTVTVAGNAEIVAAVSPEMLRLALLGKVVTVDDNVSLLPQDVAPAKGHRPLVEAARRSLHNTVGLGWTTVLLTVTGADPGQSALVTMDTVVRWRDGEATAGSATPAPVHEDPGPTVEDLAGLHSQADRLTELLDLGFHHREVLDRLGTTAQLGILVTGPAGSGKSTLVKAVAAAVNARVVPVWAPSLAALTNDAASNGLRDALASARSKGPAVLLITDVEALAGREDPGPLATVLQQRITEAVAAGIAVVCTTSRPEAVDPQLRRPGVLDHEIVVPLPDAAHRRQLLDVLVRSVPLADDVSLEDVAARTPGFVAADLLALVREAGVRAAMRQKEDANPQVAKGDFDAALEVVRPTSMAESTLQVAKVSLDDVGDMVEVKQALTETVLWPLSYPDTFSRLGIQPPRGVLLYGPPGCGKTYLVKALAGSGQANVLSVKGAEVLSKWVGESERAVRELFRRAREAAPTLVFLDEIDALAPVRGQASDGGTTDRVVAALLTELDGVEDLRNVVVIGATNRPDLVDPALLRPGRLERLVYVPPPDAEARAAILTAVSRNVPLSPDVDLTALGAELDGFSAADCAALIREAALTAMRESMESATVTGAHVKAARERTRPSLDPSQVAWLAAYAEAHQPG
jgi:transitional endoplasmic reticulum ATPase